MDQEQGCRFLSKGGGRGETSKLAKLRPRKLVRQARLGSDNSSEIFRNASRAIYAKSVYLKKGLTDS